MKCALTILLMMVVPALAAPFSSITNGMDFLKVGVANELKISYNERVEALDSTATNLFVEGGVATTGSIWVAMQNFVETTHDEWLDTSLTNAAGTYVGQTNVDFNYASLTSFYARVGMKTNGWRRAVSWDPSTNDWTDLDDPMYLYGQIETGDIFGPWIYDDLQRSFSGLIWSEDFASKSITWTRSAIPGFVAGIDTGAKATNLTAATWASASWVIDSPPVESRHEVRALLRNTAGGTLWRADSQRWRTSNEVTVATGTHCVVRMYEKAGLPTYQARPWVYEDIDNTGASAVGQWGVADVVTQAVPGVVTQLVYRGFFDEDPVQASSIVTNTAYFGYEVIGSLFAVEWDFTYIGQQ